MKHFLCTLLITLAALTLAAVILTVDNNIPSSGQYTTLYSAYNSAAAGDTIFIYPSTIDYGGLGVGKQLTFIGAGTDPANPEMVTSKCSPSMNSASGAGSVFIGLDLSSGMSVDYAATYRNCRMNGYVSVYRPGTVLEECQFKSFINIGNGSISTPDIVIRRCIFDFDSTHLNIYQLASVVCYNCIFKCSGYSMISCAQNNVTAAFYNNVFVNRGTGTLYLAAGNTSTANLIFINNIFETISNVPANFTYLYNIWEGTPAGVSGTGNQFGVNLANVMVDVNGGNYHYTDESLALDAGQGGADIGLYGGDYPFDDLWYLTYLPSITDFTCPAIINAAGQLNVHIEAKVGN